MRKMCLATAIAALALLSAGSARASCPPDSVGAKVFDTIGGDPSNGQVTAVLHEIDQAIDPVEGAAETDVPIC